MIPIYMMFTALASTALATGSIECNFSVPTGAQCFGAEGQMLIFHVPNTFIRLKKDKCLVLKIDQKVTLYKDCMNDSEYLTDGTFKLGKAMKRHSGDYVMDEYDSNGRRVKTVTVHLEIKAPVSKPAVSQVCLSPEQMSIACSSEGDEVHLSLTLDGLSLMQSRDLSLRNHTVNMQSLAVTVSLHGQLTGHLMCLVWNNVSRDETVIRLTSCKGHYLHDYKRSLKDFCFVPVIVAVIASAVALLLLVALCLCIICPHNKPRPMPVEKGHTEDEVVYTGVRIRQKPRAERTN